MTLPARVDDAALDSLLQDLLAVAEDIDTLRAVSDPAERVRRSESVANAARALTGHVDRVRRDAIVDLNAAGMTVRAIAAAVGLSAARVGQILTAEAKAQALAFGSYTSTAGDRQRHDREAYRVARHAQELRAEAYGLGYREETAAFYGATDVAQYEHAETALTFRAWLEGSKQEETA